MRTASSWVEGEAFESVPSSFLLLVVMASNLLAMASS